jgi:peptidoglycan hydrolase-like protein with peptidoglycan-binding domain
MKTILPVFLGLFWVGSLWADDLTRAVQQHLKDQGFYYGEVDGQGGEETTAAIRRYQIRYGLRVNGQLDEETLKSLGMSRNSTGEPERAPSRSDLKPPPANPGNPPSYNNKQYYPPAPDSYGAPSGPRGFNGFRESAPLQYGSLSGLFAGTFYERAPTEVQQNVLMAIQGELSKRGFYEAPIDGVPGPATSDAIARFQQERDLRPTGRLDDETLDELQAMPGQRNGPPTTGMRRGWRYP